MLETLIQYAIVGYLSRHHNSNTAFRVILAGFTLLRGANVTQYDV